MISSTKPAKIVKEEVPTDTTQVLVAKTHIPLGAITGTEDFRWQDWPQQTGGQEGWLSCGLWCEADCLQSYSR
jgi:Flp pilus assembly protein CpaB